MPIEDAASGTSRATNLAKPGSPGSRAYVTFLDGNDECVTGVVRLAEGLKKVKTAYSLVVAVLPGVPEKQRSMLVAQDCIVREIERVCLPKNQTQFAMADYAINYSKICIWEFVEYYKMIYLDGDTLVSENIDFLFDLPNGFFYAVNDYFGGKTGSHTPQYGYQWPAELGLKAPLYFNAGMFVFEPSLSIYEDLLLNTLKGTHPSPFAEQVEKIKEMEFRAVDAEGKAAEAERKLQSMVLMLKSSEQEIGSLKAQLASLACAIEAAKQEGCNEASVVYEGQFARLVNVFFENGWTSALDQANVPADSDLRENVPYPRPEIAGRENDVAEGAEARDDTQAE